MTTTLLDLLSMVNHDVLATLRQAYRLPKSDMPALAHALAQPEVIQQAYRNLPPPEKALLDRLLLRGSDQAAGLQIELVQLGLVKPDLPAQVPAFFHYVASPARLASQRFGDVYARLLAAGLVFTSAPSFFRLPPLDFSPGEWLCAPDEVRRALPRPQAVVAILEDQAVKKRLNARPELTALRFFAFWEYVKRQPIRTTMQGDLHRTDLRKVGRALMISGFSLTDEDALELADFYAMLAGDLDLLETDEGVLSSEEAPRIFEQGQSALLRAAYAAFIERGRPALDRGLAIYSRDAKLARTNLVHMVQALPAGVWISLASFVQHVQLLAPELLRSRKQQAGTGAATWEAHETLFISDLIRGPLHWLAVCDLAFGDDGRLLAFRILPETLPMLLAEQVPVAPAPGLLVIQPTFQVIALPPLALDRLRQLSDMADLVRLSEAPEFKLTKASLYRAAQAGYNLDQVVELLQGWSRAPLPANVQREMEEWAGRHARVTLRRSAPLLQTENEALLNELLADQSLAPFFGERLAPTVVELTTDERHSPQQLWRALLARGEMAMRMSPTTPAGGWQVDAEGELRSVAALPDALWLPILQRVAEPVATSTGQLATVWKITPEKVRALADSKASPAPYLVQLQKLLRAPLPGELLRQIERWARPPETAQVGQVILLKVGTLDTATQLLADRSLRGALTPLPGADGRWLMVKEDALPKVRARLAAWEVTVTEGSWG